MTLSAELLHAPSEESEMNSKLYEYAEISEGQRLEDRDRRGRICRASILLGEREPAEPSVGQKLDSHEDPFTVLGERKPWRDRQFWSREKFQNLVAQTPRVTVQNFP